MDKKDSFADTYGINLLDYKEVEIENANFSVRTYRRLKTSEIDNVVKK